MVEFQKIVYISLVYFSWIPILAAALLVRTSSRRSGSIAILSGGVIQIGSFLLHIYESNRLVGTPDRLYVWILPLLTAVLGFCVSVCGLMIALLHRRSRRTPNSRRSGGD